MTLILIDLQDSLEAPRRCTEEEVCLLLNLDWEGQVSPSLENFGRCDTEEYCVIREYTPLPNTLERARVLHSELVAVWRNMTEIAEQTDNWDGVAEVEAMLSPEDRER